MKKMQRILSWCLALCMLLSMLPVAAFAAEIEEYPVIEPDTLVTVNINKSGDIAYFRVTPTYSESYTFYSTGSSDTYGYIYDSGMNMLKSNDDDGDGSNFLITYDLEAGVTYVLAVRFYSSSTTGSFQVYLKANHAYESQVITPAVCTEAGLMGFTCTICGAEYTEEIPAGHNVESVETKAPTCTEPGELTHTCTICGDTTKEEIPVTSHNIESVETKAPTCKEPGELTHTCTICGDTTKEEIPALGHSYDDGTVLTAHSCTEDGEIQYTCTACGHAQIKPLFAAHTLNEDGTACGLCAETCIAAGGSGNNDRWVLYNDGSFVISGTGKSFRFQFASDQPWKDYRNSITSLTVQQGVTILDYNVFTWCDKLTAVRIPDSVTSIGYAAFSGCSSLTFLDIPDSVISIDSNAFKDCSSLTTIDLPDNLTSIADNAFYNCSSLISVSIPDRVTSIGYHAFENCSSLTTVDLPDNLTSIGNYVFRNCSSLVSISIPDKITSIGYDMFTNCSSLVTVNLPKNLTSITGDIFDGCSNIKTIAFNGDAPSSSSYKPFDGITATAYYPAGNTTWTSSVKQDFGGNITWMEMPETCVAGNHVFTNYVDDGTATCQKNGSKSAPCEVCGFRDAVPVPNSKVDHRYSSYVYDADTNITTAACDFGCGSAITMEGHRSIVADTEQEVTISAGGQVAYFTYTPAYTERYVFRSVGNYSTSAYPRGAIYDKNLKVLTSNGATTGNNFYLEYTLQAGSTYILGAKYSNTSATGAFTIMLETDHNWDADSLLCIDCGSALHEEGMCGDDLTWVLDQTGTLTISGTGAMTYGIPYYLRPLVRKAVLADGQTSVANEAFEDCSRMTSIEMPESITSIGYGAFADCSSLISVDIPAGVTTLEDSLFYNCSSLISVVIPAGITSIGNSTFSNCSSLTSVVIPAGVTSIGSYAFSNCSSLTSVVIPTNVTSIGSSAFKNCSSLKMMVFKGNAPSIYSDAFYNSTFTACYPVGNETWTDDVRQNYYGTITWFAMPEDCLDGNHVFVNYVADGNATCQMDGTKTALCEACGFPDTVADPGSQEDHRYSSYVYDADTNTSTSACDFGCGATDTIEGHRAIMADAEETVTISAGGNIAYFAFTPAYTESYTFYSIGTADTYGYLYDGNMNQLASNDDGAGNYQFSITSTLVAGKTYILGAKYRSSYGIGTFTVKLQTAHDWNADSMSCTHCGKTLHEEGTCGANLTWTLDETGKLTISGTGAMTSAIPERLRLLVREAVLPDGMTSICGSAFYGASRLTTIDIPDSVTSIGSYAFDNCSSLTSIDFPAGITSIGSYAFQKCGKLKTVLFKGDAPSISSYAFYNTTTTAYYPAGNETWTDSVKSNYNGRITWVAAPEDCLAGNHVFVNYVTDGNATCQQDGTKTALCEVCGLSETVADPGSRTDHRYSSYVYDADTNTSTSACDFACGAVSTIEGHRTIVADTEQLVTIGTKGNIAYFAFTPDYTESYTFYSIGTADTYGYLYDGNLNQLKSNDNGAGNKQFSITETLVAGKTYILGAKYYSSSATGTFTVKLQTVHDWNADSLTCTKCGMDLHEEGTCGANLTWVLDENGKLTISGTGAMTSAIPARLRPLVREVVLPDGMTSIYSNAFDGSNKLTSIDIPDSVTSIGSYAFNNCSGLTSVDIPEGITSLSNYIFYGCSSLTSVDIPDSVTTIGAYAFYNCSGLTSIDIPDSVTSIGGSAFCNCSGLTSIDIPNRVTSLASSIFSGCSSLTAIDIPDSVTSIGSYAFSGCSSLTSIEIPYGVTSVGNYAFNNCSSLTSLVIPEGVTTIGERVFYGCSSLASIDIPDSVTSIGYYAFGGCSGLTSIDIPDSVTTIGGRVFYDCSSLTSVDIPDSVTSIGSYAFYGCSSLISVDIPEGVTTIGERVFLGCSSLTSVDIPDSVTSIGDYAFYNCSSLTSVVIPAGVTSIGSHAFEKCGKLKAVVFKGDAPSINLYAFYNTTTTAYYPADNETWTDSVKKQYTGTITWVAMPADCLAGNHVFASYVSDGNATCQKDGTKTALCDVCGFPDTVADPGSQVDHRYSSYVYDADTNTSTSVCDFGCGTTNTIEGHPVITADVEQKVIISTGGNMAYFAFTPAYTESYTFYSIGNYDTYGYLYDSDMKQLAAVDQGGAGNNFSITYTMEAGKTYILGAKYYSSSTTGTFSVMLKTVHNWDADSMLCAQCGVELYEEGTCGKDLTWVLDRTGKLTISGTGAMTSAIPERLRPLVREAVLPDGLTSIYSNAFNGSSRLTSIDIPASVTSIGYYAFFGCSSLTSVDIPDGVTVIYDETFYNCSSLTDIDLPDNLTSIGKSAFYNCSSLTGIDLPDSITSIGNSAFSGCSSLTTIDLPDNLTSISENMFSRCSSLESVDIPESITSAVGRYAFYNCSSLTSIHLPDNITSIAFGAFEGCSSLTKIDLPDNLIYIIDYAFNSCRNLVSIEIPASVTTIGNLAFGGCTNLRAIAFYGDVPSIDSTVFSGVIAAAYYPADNETWTDSVKKNYEGTITWVPMPAGCVAGNHVFTTYVANDNATCMRDGTKSASCEVCGFLDTVPNPGSVSDHRYNGYVYDANTNTSTSPCDFGCGMVSTIAGHPAIEADVQQKVIIANSNQVAYFTFTPSLTDVYRFEAFKTAYEDYGDKKVYLYDSEWNLLEEDDDWVDYLTYAMEAGKTYILSAEYSGSGTGTFGVLLKAVHSWDADTLCCEYCEAPLHEEGKCGENLTWVLDETGKLTISGTGEMTDSIDWSMRPLVRTAELSSGITSIYNSAFSGCSNLTSISIPEGVTSIESWAFEACSSLKTIIFRGDAPVIQDTAFNSVTARAYYLAENETWTDDVKQDYWGNLTWIGMSEDCFAGNHAFTKYTSDHNATCQEDGTKTAYCDNCEFPNTIADPGSMVDHCYSGYVYDASTNTSTSACDFDCGTTHTIEGYRVMTADVTQWVNINEGGNIAYFTYTPAYTESYTFYGISTNGDYADTQGYIYDSQMNILAADDSSGWNGHFYIEYTLEAGKTYILGAKYYDSGETGRFSLKLQTNHQWENDAFICTQCGKIIDEEGVCGDNLTWTLDSTGTLTISGTGEMTSTIPDDLQGYVLRVVVSSGVTSICDKAFYGCYNLKSVDLPDTVSAIGKEAFYDCGSLASIELPAGVSTIGEYAFAYCYNLITIKLPAGITGIAEGTFSGCSSLSTVELPAGVTTIGAYAFNNCYSLTSMELPAGLTTIGESAFYWTGLASIELPAGVAFIGEYAFGQCYSLDIYFTGDAPQFGGEYIFEGVNDANAYYPIGNETWTTDVMQDYGGNITWLGRYEILEGDNAVVDLGENGELLIRAAGEIDKFERVTMDGETVDPANYTVTEGSTIITFALEYLKTLEEGDHVVMIYFEDGVSMAEITIKKPTYILGDVNSDGKVNTQDRTILARYLAKWSDYPESIINMQAADVNCDGKVNTQDRTILARHLAKWTGYETLGA